MCKHNPVQFWIKGNILIIHLLVLFLLQGVQAKRAPAGPDHNLKVQGGTKYLISEGGEENLF